MADGSVLFPVQKSLISHCNHRMLPVDLLHFPEDLLTPGPVRQIRCAPCILPGKVFRTDKIIHFLRNGKGTVSECPRINHGNGLRESMHQLQTDCFLMSVCQNHIRRFLRNGPDDLMLLPRNIKQRTASICFSCHNHTVRSLNLPVRYEIIHSHPLRYKNFS